MSKESYTVIETKPNGARIEHGIFWDLNACTTELERLCFSGKYPGSKWSFITKWEGFGDDDGGPYDDDDDMGEPDYWACYGCGKTAYPKPMGGRCPSCDSIMEEEWF